MHKILVIDDNPDVLDILRIALEIEGYEVMVANGGTAGLTKLQEECPDLILLDYSMPDMSGIDVAKQARMVHDDLPIIFITAHGNFADPEIKTISKAALVPKPFMLSTLSHRVTTMLQNPVN
jgi:DNA-binding response OmpR family regulator